MVIHSEGLRSVCFLLTNGYHIILHDVLYVLGLTTSLLSSNKFAKDYCQTYRELVNFLTCKWVNCHTEATEFTATIHSTNLMYMDWRVEPHY